MRRYRRNKTKDDFSPEEWGFLKSIAKKHGLEGDPTAALIMVRNQDCIYTLEGGDNQQLEDHLLYYLEDYQLRHENRMTKATVTAKTELLIQKVDRIVKEWRHLHDKYDKICLYDHIVEILNQEHKLNWEGEEGRFIVVYDYVKNEYDVIHAGVHFYALSPAKKSVYCEAMIASKAFKPYLDKIFLETN